MKTKHTHGDWHMSYFGDKILVDTKFKRSYGFICEVIKRPQNQQIANAKLIAAAPDLLEALTELLNMSNYRHEYSKKEIERIQTKAHRARMKALS